MRDAFLEGIFGKVLQKKQLQLSKFIITHADQFI